MSNQYERCIYCGCSKDEHGKWTVVVSESAEPADDAAQGTICSSCSAEKFPQYYGNGSKPGALTRLKCQWLNIISSRGW